MTFSINRGSEEVWESAEALVAIGVRRGHFDEWALHIWPSISSLHTNTHMHTYTEIQIHMGTHTQIWPHTETYTNSWTHTHRHTHACKYFHTQIPMPTQALTYTYMHETHKNGHTHSHTHLALSELGNVLPQWPCESSTYWEREGEREREGGEEGRNERERERERLTKEEVRKERMREQERQREEDI